MHRKCETFLTFTPISNPSKSVKFKLQFKPRKLPKDLFTHNYSDKNFYYELLQMVIKNRQININIRIPPTCFMSVNDITSVFYSISITRQ